MNKDYFKKLRNLDLLYKDYNLIQDYLETKGDWIECPHCHSKVPTYSFMTMDKFKAIFPKISRQMIWAKLDKMHKLGWIEKINFKRQACRIKKYWRPSLKKIVANKIKKRR